ncbi:MAG: energy-coupling factor ABC transporter ATP-binding protein [Gemmatimonadales bacterium]
MSILPLRLDAVGYAAGGRTLLEEISATLEAGCRTVILGANGAGKTVLMRLCHGLLVPTTGSIVWASAGEPGRQAMVFQRPVMLRRSALANVAFPLKAAGVARSERQDRAAAALAEVGLSARAGQSARLLSAGEQQRLALARAWVTRPEVLFLDEPTSSLDPTAAREVEAILGAVHAAGTKLVLTTHNLGQARRLGDEVLFLHQGRMVERGPAARLLSDPSSAEARAYLAGELP